MIDWKTQLKKEVRRSEDREASRQVFKAIMSDMLHEAKLTKLGKNRGWREQNASRFLSRKSFMA
jgi:hypothetical protein